MRNLVKLVILLLVSITSLEIASSQINDLVKEVKSREETITDAIIKQQVKETFEQVEQKIAKVVEEEQIEIKTEKIEMKPPVVKEEPKQVAEEVTEPALNEEEIAETLEVVQEEVSEEISEVISPDLTTLTKEDIVSIGQYLVDNYFLDGYMYYQAEQDPLRYERKKLSHEMEVYVIESLKSVFKIVSDMKTINEETISSILNEAQRLSGEFDMKFKEAGAQGDDFQVIYEEIIDYFRVYTGTLQEMKASLTAIKQAPNPALVMTIMMKDLNEVIIPGLKEVINSGLDLKAQINKIYLEGIEGKVLLTREEVIGIIKDPTQVIGQEKEPEDTTHIQDDRPIEQEENQQVAKPEDQEPEDQVPEDKEPDGQVPEEQVPEDQVLDGQVPEEQVPEDQDPEGQATGDQTSEDQLNEGEEETPKQ